MFLYQKFGYTTNVIKTVDEMNALEFDSYNYICFDTETDGLHIIKNKPFLYSFGVDKSLYTFEPTKELVDAFIELLNKFQRVFAHNAKYDYHMTWNILGHEPNLPNIACSMTVFRLTSYCDIELSDSLASVGYTHVDKSAKFASSIIKKIIENINRERKLDLKKLYYAKYPKGKFRDDWDKSRKKVQFVDESDEVEFIVENYKEANYYDVSKKEPALMKAYALDDIVIMLEYLKNAIPILDKVDPNLKIFNQECDLIRVTARMERIGFKVDIDYFKKSRERLKAYQEELYNKLWEYSDGKKLTVNQNAQWAKLILDKYKINLFTEKVNKKGENKKTQELDKKVLAKLTGNAQELGKLITRLRTIDMWIATFIDGKLNSVHDGRFYTTVKNSGTVSGRVSSNLQQQPKEPLLDENGEELFNPRKCYIPDKGYSFLFCDFSQMELRVQAFYTLLIGSGDINLCRAYIPFKCRSMITGEIYDPASDLKYWNSKEWVLDETGELWEPVDLHDITTLNAFPFLGSKNHKEFAHYRKYGKICNFLKNYQGGIKALNSQLDVDEETVKLLNEAYNKSYPKVRDYQLWVNEQLYQKGFIANLFGRRYYMREQKNYYKAANYVIQGSCADLFKKIQIDLDKHLNETKTKFIMPIHDEAIFLLHDDEHYLIKELKTIMEDTLDYIPLIPMISDVEIGRYSWGEKEDYYNEF